MQQISATMRSLVWGGGNLGTIGVNVGRIGERHVKINAQGKAFSFEARFRIRDERLRLERAVPRATIYGG